MFSHCLFSFSILYFITGNRACPSGWLIHDTSCYHFSHDQEPWMVAQLVCQGFGGKLAEIETRQEDDFLIGEVKQLKGVYFWIGADDLEVEREWRWWSNKQMLSYTNWLPGEPNNGNDVENCAMIWERNATTIGWNDSLCSNLYSYICEIPGEQLEVVG